MTDSLVPTSHWPNFNNTNKFDFDKVQKRCGDLVAELMYWASEFERKMYGVNADIMYANLSYEKRQ